MKIDYWAKFEENCCYHIYNRTIGNELLFKREGNWDFFMEKWKLYLGPYTSTYAYCLIPNHFHFLVKFKQITPSLLETIRNENTRKGDLFLAGDIDLNEFIVDQFKRFFTSYSGAYNKENNRQGSLFQSKFKRIFVKNRAHFEYLLFYIHHNPIHHKLVDNYRDWMRSSYNIILSEEETFIAKEIVLQYFSDEKDQLGKENFQLKHEQFKQNFVRHQNQDELRRLNMD